MVWTRVPLLLALLSSLANAQRGDVDVVRIPAARVSPDATAGNGPVSPPGTVFDRSPVRRARRNVLLVGYWPPSNEAIRRFSTDPAKNPSGWIGRNWEGRGYDLHAFFPSFVPPDCFDCGQGSGDFEVDYQDTTADFNAISEELRPIAVVTFSRGFIDRSWELESNQFNRNSWAHDFQPPFMPTPSPPDATVPVNFLRPTLLPVREIVNAIDTALPSLDPFICFSGSGGGFLSEYLAYFGVWYQDRHRSPADPDWCVTAGHVHVGGLIDWPTARAAAKVTVREVLDQVDQARLDVTCQPSIGFQGPGSSRQRVCGDPLGSGGFADVRLIDAPPGANGFLLMDSNLSPAPFAGGAIINAAAATMIPITTDADGSWTLENFQGSGGPQTVYTQFMVADPTQPQGYSISNAVAVELLP